MMEEALLLIRILLAAVFAPFHRAAVAAVPRADLDLTGIAFRTERRDADKITKGLRLHT